VAFALNTKVHVLCNFACAFSRALPILVSEAALRDSLHYKHARQVVPRHGLRSGQIVQRRQRAK
jgi:hypothetical protein